jgi:hypothetical protein
MAPLNSKCDRQLATNYDGVSKRNTWDAAAPVKLDSALQRVQLISSFSSKVCRIPTMHSFRNDAAKWRCVCVDG